MYGTFFFGAILTSSDDYFQEYGAGRMLTGEVKKRLIEVLSGLVERHRKARAAVTDEVSSFILYSFQRLLASYIDGSHNVFLNFQKLNLIIVKMTMLYVDKSSNKV